MRYDEFTDTVALNISELCVRGDNAERSRMADLAGLSLTTWRVKYEREGITYTLIGSDYTSEQCICDVNVSAKADTAMSPSEHALLAAFLLCIQTGANSAGIKMLRIGDDGDVLQCVDAVRSRAALEKYFLRRITPLCGAADMLCRRAQQILPSAAQVKLPYASLRTGQRLMMSECYDSMRHGKRLFIQAPTGIGKTISALYPAVKYLGQGGCDKIFYITAKTSTQREAYKTAGILFRGGACLRTVVLSAKEQICLHREHITAGRCDVSHCRAASASEDAMRAAVNELLSLQNGYEAGIMRSMAAKYGVCPYELSLSLAEYCELVIADYNYVFDPLVFLQRFFSEQGDDGRYILLVDEAHNLADRARNMLSARLVNTEVRELRGQSESMLPELTASLDELLADFDMLRRLCAENTVRGEDGVKRGFYISRERDASFDAHTMLLCRDLGRRLVTGAEQPGYASMARLYRALRRYLVATELCGESSNVYCQFEGDRVDVQLLCIDPSAVLDARMQRFQSVVLFSATLTPPDYFNDILGGGRDAVNLALRSPYDENRLFLGAVTDISTRFEDRERSLARTVSYIAATVSAKRGNYMVYFPSYDYMHRAAELFGKRFPRVCLLEQTRGMSRADREEFLAQFRLDDGAMRVGFCVLGGSFSEGVDLPGRCLIGAVIVGVGIPGLSGERNIMRDYFQLTRESGYDYAYTYPGMNNVLQAAGRVIRSNTDSGVVVLIDDRYATDQYKAMYPEHWQGMKYYNQPASLNADIIEFWREISSKNADN